MTELTDRIEGHPRADAGMSEWKHRAWLVACSAIAILAVMEVVLRAAGYGNVEVYAPDQDLLWRLKPNQKTVTKIGQKHVRINSHGLRDREFAQVKPPGTVRILALGDSCTYGWGVGQEETYAKVLERKLNRNGGGERYEVINAGVIGYSLAQELKYLVKDGAAWNPDLVLVSHTFNEGNRVNPDSAPAIKEKVFASMRLKNVLRNIALYHFVVEYNFAEQYAKLAARITEDPTWIDEEYFARYERQLQEIVDFTRAREMAVAFLITVTKHQVDGDPVVYSRHQQAMMRVGERNGVPVVNLLEPFRKERHRDLYLDGGHPAEVGHQIMAETIYHELREGKGDN
jgi:lysophospholipase L1-like esterase